MELSARKFQPRMRQHEKTAETRKRLLDAGILCLAEKGFARTTTSEVADRAGLSRGCQSYHFRTRKELLIGLLERLSELWTDSLTKLEKDISRTSKRNERWDDAIRLLFKRIYRGPTFLAWIELLIAARTDDALTVAVRKLNAKLTERMRGIFRHFANRPGAFEMVPIAIGFLMDGITIEAGTFSPEFISDMTDFVKGIDWHTVAEKHSP
jgi:AcrR family transcriptional regulator